MLPLDPHHLHVFHDTEDFRLKSFAESNLWFSYRENYNDPYDCKCEFHNDLDNSKSETGHKIEELRNLFKGYYDGGTDGRWDSALLDLPTVNTICEWCDGKINGEKLKEVINQQLDRLGIRCFFRGEPDSVLMWAHYAENHKGYCVDYKKSCGSVPILPLNYTHQRNRIYLSEFLFGSRTALTTIVHTKNAIWAYENEARLVVQPPPNLESNSNSKGFCKPLSEFNMKVDSIYLGMKIGGELKDKIVSLAKKNNWQVRSCVVNPYDGSKLNFAVLND